VGCGCETWSVTLSEEHRQRVFENRVRRQIFGPKRDEVTEEWEILNDQYTSSNIIRAIQIKNEMGGVCIMYGGKERCIQDFGGEK